jgi:gamma-glutamyl-gamma-aminobutyrate hydrolase PuuD
MLNNALCIGITMRVLNAKDYHEPRDVLAQDWARFLHAAFPSVKWIQLPNLGASAIRTYCEKWGVNRLLLTGGEDIGVSSIRDETENELLTWAKLNQIPVLGICRGMQMIAIHSGSTLKAIKQHVLTRHTLIGYYQHEVNSFHRHNLVNCPVGFTVLARAEDGEIEAISDPALRWQGWMWHPERENPFNPIDIKSLRKLFS